jgi:hypothetical protein
MEGDDEICKERMNQLIELVKHKFKRVKIGIDDYKWTVTMNRILEVMCFKDHYNMTMYMICKHNFCYKGYYPEIQEEYTDVNKLVERLFYVKENGPHPGSKSFKRIIEEAEKFDRKEKLKNRIACSIDLQNEINTLLNYEHTTDSPNRDSTKCYKAIKHLIKLQEDCLTKLKNGKLPHD